MPEKTLKFKSQITPPEQSLERPDPLTVNEGEPFENAVGQCQDIVETKTANILHATMQGMADRISNLSNVEDSGIINNIELLQAALFNLFQKIKFEQYDLEYGLTDHEDQVVAPLAFSGDSFETLKFLEGVAWITEAAKASLAGLNKDIQDLETIITRAEIEKGELDDEPQNKRERAKHQGTIDSRTPRKKKKVARRRILIEAINDFLRVDPEDQEALWKEAEKLLTFMVQNKHVEQETTTEKVKCISSIPKSLLMNKTIIPEEKTPREKVQYERVAKRKKPGMTRRNIVLLTVLGLLTLGTAASPLLKSYLQRVDLGTTMPLPENMRRPSPGSAKKPGYNPPRMSDESLDKEFAYIEAHALNKRVQELLPQVNPDGSYKHTDEIQALQRKITALNNKFDLGLKTSNKISFPRRNLTQILDNLHYDVDLETFKELIIENSYVAVHEMFKYKVGSLLKDHYVGKMPLFAREFIGHHAGPVAVSITAVTAEEKKAKTELEYVDFKGRSGKLDKISTAVNLEIVLSGAINKTIKKTLIVPGVRFVPEVPFPKTYKIQTPKGITFLTMAELKRLNLKPGDYLVGHSTSRNSSGGLDIIVRPNQK